MNDDRSGVYCDETLIRELIVKLTALEVNLENVKSSLEVKLENVKYRIESIERSSQELSRNLQELKTNYDKALGGAQLFSAIVLALITLTAGFGGYFLSGQVSEVKQEVEHNHAPVKQVPEAPKTPTTNQGR